VTLRHADSDGEIAACFPVMRELRPHLAGPGELVRRVRSQMAGGYRILAAWQDGRVIGLAGYRPQENLIRGPFCYVDDLVVSGEHRCDGLGARLLDGVSAEARRHHLPFLVLDTALDNSLGQRFYFRYGMLPAALRFTIPIGSAGAEPVQEPGEERPA
jgi:ribosomal protein S18 acetylase RimI-like enzyme